MSKFKKFLIESKVEDFYKNIKIGHEWVSGV